MREIRVALIVLLALLPLFAFADPVPQVTMTASLDKSVYQNGNPIVLEVDLHNSENSLVRIGGGAFEPSSFVLTLKEASGQMMPRTALGQRILTPPQQVYWNPVVAIRPQGTRRYRVDLTALFGISRPGSYTVHISRTFMLSPTQDYTLTAGPLSFQSIKGTAPQTAPVRPFVPVPNADVSIP